MHKQGWILVNDNKKIDLYNKKKYHIKIKHTSLYIF